MASKINRLPAGLQDIVGNVASGENPQILPTEVSGQFDILPLWMTDKITQYKTTNAAAAVVGDSAFVEVPERKIWIPVSFGGTFTATAIGDELGMGLIAQKQALGFISSLGESNRLVSAAALELIRYGIQFPFRVAYPPGWRFYAIATVMAIAAGVRTIEAQMLTYEVSI